LQFNLFDLNNINSKNATKIIEKNEKILFKRLSEKKIFRKIKIPINIKINISINLNFLICKNSSNIIVIIRKALISLPKYNASENINGGLINIKIINNKNVILVRI
jgi:hypothetical protein